jgi:RpiR family transcriptional regulator, carbohydrate utilization regulator
MPDIVVKMNSLQASFSQAERRVAQYLAGQPETAALQSISELADSAGVSVASVSRLARTLGYSSFKKFKGEVLQATMAKSNNLQAMFQAITEKDTDAQIVDKVFRGNIKSLEDTLSILSVSDLARVARLLAHANRIVFFGIGSSGNIAHDAALRFSLLDIQAEAYSDPQHVVVQSLRMHKNEIAVGISHSGRSEMIVQALQIAAGNGAKTLGISNYQRSPLHQVSGIFLCTAFAESRVKVAALSSRIAQMCLVDTLYLLTARCCKSLKKAEVFNEYAEKMLRLPAR